VRTDSGPIALQAFWGMDVEAMNFIAMPSTPQHRPLTAFAAHLARSPGTIRQRNQLAFPDSSECPAAIKQRC
jgi:hypothetical protein